ncbi:DUF4118 domain-containing protein [Tsuneonella flava]|uniref:histidine kinase n=1 Tax=Tsuneonella flava TaxID=2055955 RepID=A0ABX7KCU5_9SPHN|nr:ATP-binding protein [Tsuneonella flava]QSB44320.1 DUF4118 domain-containing protein [Tsuneonella flava]
MTAKAIRDYAGGLIAVGLITVTTSHWLPSIGIASSALLFLLPVVLASVRGNLGAGLVAAGSGAMAYNFFLLPPRFTLRVDGFDNVVSVVVLFGVALVTSRLAAALKARELEAQEHADASSEQAQFASLLADEESSGANSASFAWLGQRYGDARLIFVDGAEPNWIGAVSLSAMTWAMHHGEVTGHGTEIMSAADWTFIPLRRSEQCDVLAIEQPTDGRGRAETDIAQLRTLAALLGQKLDRTALREERTARQRLEDRDTLRRAFLASLAHDFRTPLTVLRAGLAQLAGQVDASLVTDLVRQGHRLDRMMDDLIGAARIESGAIAPQLEAIDIVDAVADALDALRPVLMERDISRDVSADLPLVSADPVLFRHVLINLIDNAVRHSTARIAISAKDTGQTVRLAVEDDGPGIPAGQEDAIFDRFVQLAGNDRSGGTGLGLSIAKGFAEAMGSNVKVARGASGGACFVLDLPVLQGEEAS